MESSLVGPNFEYDLKDIVEVVKNLDCDCILWRDDNYIHQNNHDETRG